MVSVSEAPKEAPVRKFVPASVYLEEKTDEQKKEEVRPSANAVSVLSVCRAQTGHVERPFFYSSW